LVHVIRIQGFFQGIKRPGRALYHFSSSSAEFKDEWTNNSTPLTLLHGINKDKVALSFTSADELYLEDLTDALKIRTYCPLISIFHLIWCRRRVALLIAMFIIPKISQ